MNNRSAKGKRHLDFEVFLNSSVEGDWFIEERNPPEGIWIHVPGVGDTFITTLVPQIHNGALWHWDGNREAPTVTPSIHIVGQWHGWMKNGELIST